MVACLSALDSYVHAVLYDRIPSIMRQNSVPEPLCEELASIMLVKNGKSFRNALPLLRSHDSVAELVNRLKEEKLSETDFMAVLSKVCPFWQGSISALAVLHQIRQAVFLCWIYRSLTFVLRGRCTAIIQCQKGIARSV